MPAPPPPPPPPPPMPGAAGGSPPPPPPPPPANLPARPDAKQAKGRGALLGDIQSGAKLKKVGVVNDRSAPILDSKSSNSAAPPVGGAPPVPGLRTPTAPAANRARSNSDQGSIGAGANTASVTDSAPQLGGILAGGIPKLKKTGGGINIYDSDPETNNTRKSPPPTAPAASSNGPSLLRPSAPGAAPPLPPGAPPSVASLKDNLRPTIPSASTSAIPAQSTLNKPKPPPPIGKKPPIPPPSSRKPSSTATMPQSTPPPAPPLPPPSTSPAPPSAPPPPPLPTSSAPKLPPAPPQLPNGGIQRETSLAEQAARNAFRGSSPAAAPPPPPPPPPGSLSRNSSSQSPPESPSGAPPPPPPSAPPSRPVTAPAPPPPPPSAAPRQPSISSTQQEQSSLPPPPPPPPPAAAKSASTTAVPTAGGLPIGSSAPQLPPLSSMGAASYTLTNGNSGLDDGRPGSRSASGRGGPGGGPAIWMEDSKFKFQRDDQLPKPRPFEGVVKRYRAGRGSSVPLDLGAYM